MRWGKYGEYKERGCFALNSTEECCVVLWVSCVDWIGLIVFVVVLD